MAAYQSSYADSYLIAVGIDTYTDARFQPLGSAEADASAVAETLAAPPFNFDVKLLLGADATKKAIIDTLGELRITLPDDRAIFYFAGHGYTLSDNLGNQVGYLACADTEPTNPYAGLEFHDVTKVTRWAKAKHISFILDACFSGTALGLVRAAVPQASVEEYMQRRAYQVLTAGGDEVVSDAASMTDILVETLRQGIPGQAGALTFSHVGQYVKDTVTARTKRMQIPVCQYLEGSSNGEMVLYVPPQAKPLDHLPERLRGALLSDDPEKRYYAVGDVQRLLSDSQLGEAARAVLDDLSVNDDSRDVRQRARQALGDVFVTPTPPSKPVEILTQHEAAPPTPPLPLPLQGEGEPSEARLGGVSAPPPQPVVEVSKHVAVTPPAAKTAKPPKARATAKSSTASLIVVFGAIIGVMALVAGAILLWPKGEQSASTPTQTTGGSEGSGGGAASSAGPTPTDAPVVALANPVSQSSDCGGTKIREIAAVDRYTVRFTLCEPDPAFLYKIAMPAFGVQPQSAIDSSGSSGALGTSPIGTGPFRFDRWQSGDSITLTRNDSYWGALPAYESLVFRWNSEVSTRVAALTAKDVDGIDDVVSPYLANVAADSALQTIVRESTNVFYLGMSNMYSPWDNVNVRQAIAVGIDRDWLVATFGDQNAARADYFTPCVIPNGCAGDPWPAYDPEAARALLAEAGYPDGFQTNIYYRDVSRGYAADVPSIVEELSSQLNAIGIDAAPVEMESGEFIVKATEGNLDGLYLLGWTVDFPYVTSYLDVHFAASAPQFGGDRDAELAQLLADASQLSAEQASGYYAQANNRLREIVPVVPLWHTTSSIAYLNDVSGAYASPVFAENFAQMNPGGRSAFVWMQTSEPFNLYGDSSYESVRMAQHITEGLYAFATDGSVTPTSLLATRCDSNSDLTVWTCYLRSGVMFHNGEELTANDVAASFIAQWDATHPVHSASMADFYHMDILFGFVND